MRKTANTEHPLSDPLDADVRRFRAVLVAMGKQQSLRDPIGGASAVHDLTPPQAHTVLALGHEGALTMGDLSRRCGITEKTITGIVDRLEQAGTVSRERDASDRRVVKVRLTAQGEVTFADLDRFLTERLRVFLSLVDHEDRTALCNILEKLADRLAARAAETAEGTP